MVLYNMKPVYLLYAILVSLWLSIFADPDQMFYQNEELTELELSVTAIEKTIRGDKGEEVDIIAMKDEEGLLYWYRRLRTPVCLTGECKLIDIGIYWYCTGEFLGLEVYGEDLTKTDHSEFSEADYERLMEILKNDWSKLREYELSDLVEDDIYAEDDSDIDGASGATKQEVAAEAVEDAVYTTHTIWHLIHVGEKEQLANLTADEMNRDRELYHRLLQSKTKDYRFFLLELVSKGKVEHQEMKDLLIVDGLKSDDPLLKNMAIRSLSTSGFSASLQEELAGIYRNTSVEEKLQMMPSFQKIDKINPDLFDAIVEGIEGRNEWYVVRVFQVFKSMGFYDQRLTEIAHQLKDVENPLVKKTVNEYLNESEKSRLGS